MDEDGDPGMRQSRRDDEQEPEAEEEDGPHVDIARLPSDYLLRFLAAFLDEITRANDRLEERRRAEVAAAREGGASNDDRSTTTTSSSSSPSSGGGRAAQQDPETPLPRSDSTNRFDAAPLNSPAEARSGGHHSVWSGLTSTSNSASGGGGGGVQGGRRGSSVSLTSGIATPAATPGATIERESVEDYLSSRPLFGAARARAIDSISGVAAHRSATSDRRAVAEQHERRASLENEGAFGAIDDDDDDGVFGGGGGGRRRRADGKTTEFLTASRAALANPSSTLCFHARNVPVISVEQYLLRILKYCPTTNEVFLALIVYFDRMSRIGLHVLNNPLAVSDSPPGTPDSQARVFAVDSYNVHRLIIAGVTVASKFFSDVFYTNSRYAKVCHFACAG